MLTVKFQAPIVVDEKNLSALLALAGVGAVVEPYLNGAAKPARKPKAAAPAPEPAPEPQASAETPAPVKPAGKKRGRKSNAEKEAEAAAAAAAAGEGEVPAKEPADAAPSAEAKVLVDRFAKLIDTNFEAARELLDGYGVERFSEIKPELHGDFAAKLDALGV